MRAHNGKHCKGAKREAIRVLLTQGESLTSIADKCGVSNNTVLAVRDADWRDLQRRKDILAAQAERGALLAGEKVIEAVEQGKISGSALIPAYGVFVDKAVLLRPPTQSQSTLQVEHKVSGNIFHAFAQFHADTVRALNAPSESKALNAENVKELPAQQDLREPSAPPKVN